MLTWVLPAGDYERRDDIETGRHVVIAGTYHAVESAPVGLFAAVVAVPRGFIAAAEIIGTVLFAGATWFVVDRIGTLPRIVNLLVAFFGTRRLLAIPVVSLFFATMGALENMQEEIIALIPALLLLGRGLGINAVSVVGMSAGAAMIGSAFAPTNPFQAGLAMKLAELPVMSAAPLRWAMCVAAVSLWIGWTMWYSARTRSPIAEVGQAQGSMQPATAADLVILAVAVAPIAAYVYGAMFLGWGFNELSGGFLIAGCVAGLLGGLRVAGTTAAYLQGMQGMLPAALLVGLARALSLVLADGHVIDTVLNNLAAPLATSSATIASLLMIPLHSVIHVLVPSVTGQAVLTMPILVPLSDLLGLSRQVTVLAYQTGAGLTELLTPTNGALMAVLLAAGVSFGQWLKFAWFGALLAALAGIAGIMSVILAG